MFSHVNYSSASWSLKERTSQRDVDWQLWRSPVGPTSTWKCTEGRDATNSGQPWGSVPQTLGPRGKWDTLCFGGAVDQAFLTGSTPRVLGAGEALSCREFITFSDISMFSPFDFKMHQHIRKEVCPGIAVWMKVTFVGQQRKLEELMCLPLTASSHGHPPKQCTHLERGGGGHICLVGKIQLSRQTLHEARKERGRKRGQAGWRKYIPVCQVHCAI